MAFNLGTSGNSNKLHMTDFLSGETGAATTEREIDINQLVPWENQPFRMYSESKLSELANSIKENGLLSPIIVCPLHDSTNGYRIIAGHNRVEACRKIGMTRIPSIVKDVDENRAKLIMADSNLCQRSELLPSERAYAYKAQQEALQALGSKRAIAEIADNYDESRRTIQRYISCASLNSELMEMLDSGQLTLKSACVIADLSPDVQESVGIIMKEKNIKPSEEQAKNLAERFKDTDYAKSSDILDVIAPDKSDKSDSAKQSKKITLTRKEVVGIIGDELTNDEISEYLFFCLQHEDLLDEWKQMQVVDESEGDDEDDSNEL